MWMISYLNLNNDKVAQKGGFSNDKQAIEWAKEQENNKQIIALKLLVWSEQLQCYREVVNFTA